MKIFGIFSALILAASLSAADLKVHAAASLTDVMKEIGAAYEKESSDKIEYNFGASSTLVRQIEQGAPADIFFSADEAKMDALEKQELLLADSRRDLLSNSLVLIVTADTANIPKSATELTGDAVKKIALGETQTVPAGIYAREYLEKAGLWEKLKEKVVPLESVRAVLAAVESGNVDAGFVYKTDALISKKVRVAVPIPTEEAPRILYPIAVLKNSRDPAAAKKFVEYLAGPAAHAAFAKFGFAFAP